MKVKNICVIGTGYVGLCTAVGFADMGFNVTCVGRTPEKVEKLNKGIPIIYEPGIEGYLERAIKNRKFSSTTDLGQAVRNSDATFICVGTPSLPDGSMDMADVKKASEDIGTVLKTTGYHVVVVKSTVTPETTEKIVIPALEKNSGKKAGKDFGVCMNPEFLREGVAMKDFLVPDRVVIGEYDSMSGEAIENVYMGLKAPTLRTGLKVAEMIKYTSNAFLATKISFSNEIGNICKRLGIDVYDVMRGVGMDSRISPHFLNAGAGWGGSCFPKDVSALAAKARNLGYQPRLLQEVIDTNKSQKVKMVEQLEKKAGGLKGKKVAVLGLSFKPDTDDIREASSISVIKALKEKGSLVQAYDPQAMVNMQQLFPDILYAKSAEEALQGADACLIVTEWKEFMELTDKDFSGMRNRVVLEGRKVLDSNKVKGFDGICW